MEPLHPYYPRTLDIPHYVPNRIPMEVLLAIVGSAFTVIMTSSFVSARWIKGKSVPEASRLTWFFLCSLLHCGFEAYWLYHRGRVAGRSDILAELWKEYAHGDSRYLSNDAVLVALETITIFIWGPLCMLAAVSIWNGSPNQYIWQLFASMAHLFSTALYFVMDWPEGFVNCDPHPLYFWVYFVAFNSPWLIVPLTLVVQSYKQISYALSIAHVKKSV